MSIKLACFVCGQANRLPDDKLGASPKCGACGAALVPSEPVDLSLEVLQKAASLDSLTLVVDFWAAWCRPCQMMAPELAKAARSLRGHARFAKLDTESYPEAGARYPRPGASVCRCLR